MNGNAINKLVDLAAKYGVENMARSRKQDIIFSILKAHARNGEPIYVELSFAMVRNDAGEVIGALCHARDITERFYAITPTRRIPHVLVRSVLDRKN